MAPIQKRVGSNSNHLQCVWQIKIILRTLEWCNNVVLANQLLLFWRKCKNKEILGIVATTLLTRSRDSHQNHSSAVDGWLNRIESYLCRAQSPIWLVNISSSWVKEANKEILGIVSATLLTRARKPLSAKDGSIEWSGTFLPNLV